MSIELVLVVFLAVTAVFLVGIALTRTGRGADVLDWDPSDRMAARRAADDEDLDRALQQHNAQRAADGLPPEDELDVLRRLQAQRRR